MTTLLALLFVVILYHVSMRSSTVAQLIQQFRRWDWTSAYAKTLHHLKGTKRWEAESWYWLIWLAPLPLLVSFIQMLYSDVFSIFGILFEMMVFLFVLSPDAFNVEKLQEKPLRLLDGCIAPIFLGWVLGPFAVVLYRLTHDYVNDATPCPMPGLVTQVFQGLQFIPARVTALVFALIGDFDATFEYWRVFAFQYYYPNEQLYLESLHYSCGGQSDKQLSRLVYAQRFWLGILLILWLAGWTF